MTVPAELALAAYDAGLCVVRVASDGSKRPLGKWKHHQAERPDRDLVASWFPHPGIGIVCGRVSGGLEMLELEGRAVDEGLNKAFAQRCEERGLGDLLARVVEGYCERTPSGGRHLLYRCTEVGENMKLARRPASPAERAENPSERVKVLIETRGEGGFVVVAPSNGSTHPTGRPWELLAGGFDTIATIAPEERAALLDVARSFDVEPEPERPAPGVPVVHDTDSPLDTLDRTLTCGQVLERNGFTFHHRDAAGDHYVRPGKDPRAGTSATVWRDNGTATLFSTSVDAPAEFVGKRNLRPSQLVAALEHRGDFRAAAEAAKGVSVDELAKYVGAEAPAGGEATQAEQPSVRFKAGGSWVLDAPTTVPAVWGAGNEVLWAEGEPLYLCGPAGVGKTTLGGQVVAGRLGVLPDVLGWAVKPTEAAVLYLASDRPKQIRRSLRRLFTAEHAEVLDERLVVWEGPPAFDIARHPEHLLDLAQAAGADTVVLDSLKDMAVGISDDEVGAGLNRAVQLCIAGGVEVLGFHHQRKGRDGAKPKKLEDVYGSTWITAGAGSVLLLWGEAGDPIVELVHLKQPDGDVGPLKIEHDHHSGRSVVFRGFDALRYLALQPRPVTTRQVAEQMFEKSTPTDNQMRRALRRLEALRRDGLADKTEADVGGASGSKGARWSITEAGRTAATRGTE